MGYLSQVDVCSDVLADPRQRAQLAGLRYVDDFESGYRRLRCGRGFTYRDADGTVVKSKRLRSWFKSLAIPPAWNDVWIANEAETHILARGVDEAGRTQAIYHSKWRAVSDTVKFFQLEQFASVLPRLRRRVRRDLRTADFSRARVCAAVVRLIDRGHLRVGNRKSADQNDVRGATTLTWDDVDWSPEQLELDFTAKGNRPRQVTLSDQRVIEFVGEAEKYGLDPIFQYKARDAWCEVSATTVNDYLSTCGADGVTAKVFRTWAANVAVLRACDRLSDEEATIGTLLQAAAADLGNTPSICRNSYVHPQLLASVKAGRLTTALNTAGVGSLRRGKRGMNRFETRFAAILPRLNLAALDALSLGG